MRRLALLVLVVPMLGLAACGSSSSPASVLPTNLVTNGTFTANMNGTSWGALGRVVVNRPTANSVAIFAVSTTYGLTMTLLNVTGPTTVSLINAPSNGSQAQVSGTTAQGGWATSLTGGTGSVVISALTANHITGTFSFDASPIPGTPATGTFHVTSGTFDLSY